MIIRFSPVLQEYINPVARRSADYRSGTLQRTPLQVHSNHTRRDHTRRDTGSPSGSLLTRAWCDRAISRSAVAWIVFVCLKGLLCFLVV